MLEWTFWPRRVLLEAETDTDADFVADAEAEVEADLDDSSLVGDPRLLEVLIGSEEAEDAHPDAA
jgi:hypothetical protein